MCLPPLRSLVKICCCLEAVTYHVEATLEELAKTVRDIILVDAC